MTTKSVLRRSSNSGKQSTTSQTTKDNLSEITDGERKQLLSTDRVTRREQESTDQPHGHSEIRDLHDDETLRVSNQLIPGQLTPVFLLSG
jgi:hypothetical protein